MLTVKFIEDRGVEHIYEAENISCYPLKLTAFGVPGHKDGVVEIDDGRVFIMNELGKTVASYDFRTARATLEKYGPQDITSEIKD